MSAADEKWWHDYTLRDAWWSGFIVGAACTGALIIAAQVLVAVLT